MINWIIGIGATAGVIASIAAGIRRARRGPSDGGCGCGCEQCNKKEHCS